MDELGGVGEEEVAADAVFAVAQRIFEVYAAKALGAGDLGAGGVEDGGGAGDDAGLGVDFYADAVRIGGRAGFGGDEAGGGGRLGFGKRINLSLVQSKREEPGAYVGADGYLPLGFRPRFSLAAGARGAVRDS